MSACEFIRRKKEGGINDPKDIKEFVKGYLEDSVADYQMSAWLMAVCFNGLAEDELVAYTEALIESGSRFDLSEIQGFKVDKHSTGGIGDKVSLILAPLVASCGVIVPMVSGRGLGHTGGTLDKLASIPGFRTDLTVDEFKRYLSEIGVAMMGQSADLCPADGRIYALRDVTATVESIPLIAASISAKKIAEGAQGLVLDVKVGSGAFMTDEQSAELLAHEIILITRRFGVKTTAVLTDMNQPLGKTVGNALEVAEAIACLKGQGPDDLRKIVLELAAEMLVLAGRKDRVEARKRAEDALERGKALDKFREMVRIQGGDPRIVDDPNLLPQAGGKIKAISERSGIVQSINTYQIGMLAVELGAGRRRKEDLIDPAVGFRIYKKIGDEVRKDEELATVHANDESKGLEVAEELKGCFEIGEEPVSAPRLVIKRIT
ncbi:thymidine phosphorylase [bacterium]|nr:thymidine phosphorylase [bacterium]